MMSSTAPASSLNSATLAANWPALGLEIVPFLETVTAPTSTPARVKDGPTTGRPEALDEPAVIEVIDRLLTSPAEAAGAVSRPLKSATTMRVLVAPAARARLRPLTVASLVEAFNVRLVVSRLLPS